MMIDNFKPVGAANAAFSLRHRTFRFLFHFAWALLGRWTPRPFHSWRRLILLAFGADIARGAHVYPKAKIWFPPNLVMRKGSALADDVDCYCMAQIEIGEFAVVSQGAYLCAGTHDVRDPTFPLIARPIKIEEGAWIAARSFVGPGVTVGRHAVLAACAVTVRDLEPDTIYAGNPAVAVGLRPFEAKHG